MARTDTRRRMVNTAIRLFQQEGYHATSWRKLVEEAGTPWGSAYHHFPGGKEELGVAALAIGGESVGRLISWSLEHAPTAPEGIRTLFGTTARGLERSEFRSGCPVATVALETAPGSPALTEASQAAFEGWRDIIEARLRADGLDDEPACKLALTVLSGFEGALVVARVLRSTDPLMVTGDILATAVANALAQTLPREAASQ